MTYKIPFKKHYDKLVSATKGFLERNILTRGLEIAAGIESERENPDKMLDDTGKNLTFYDVMMLDDRIKFAIEEKKILTLNVDASMVPASDKKIDLEASDFADKVINNMEITWKDVMKNLLDSRVYGFKAGEIVWNKDLIEGKWTWKKVRFRHSEFYTFLYDEFKEMINVDIGWNYGVSITVPRKEWEEKFFYMVNPYMKDDNWYGDSDLREIFTQYRAKLAIYKFRNIYLQNFAMPIPYVKFSPKEMSTTEVNDMKSMFENWQEYMRVFVPSVRDNTTKDLRAKFDVEWRDVTTAKGTDMYDKAIMQTDTMITRKLGLPDKLGFTDDSNGNRAQSEIFFDLLMMSIKDDHGRLESVVNPKIKFLTSLNFAVDQFPKYKFNEISKTVQKEMLEMLIRDGVVDKREKWIRKYTGIPTLSIAEAKEIEKQKEEDKKNMPPFNQPPVKDDKIPESKATETPEPVNESEAGKLQRAKKNFPVDVDAVEKELDTFENDFIRDFNDIHENQSQHLINQIKRKDIIENEDLKALDKVKIIKTGFKRLLSLYNTKLYLSGKVEGMTEVKDRIKKEDQLKGEYELQVQFESEWLDPKWVAGFLERFGDLGKLTSQDKRAIQLIRQQAVINVGEIENRMTKIAKNTVSSGLRSGLTGKTIISQLQANLEDDRKKFATTIARTSAATNYNDGRMNFFESEPIAPLVEAFLYSAIIDNVTTPFCIEHDGQIIAAGDPRLDVITPPNHFNCRSELVPVLVGEDELDGSFFEGYKTNKKEFPEFGAGVPLDDRLPAKGFGGV